MTALRWVWNALLMRDTWWRMWLASYAYSRFHGLTRWESCCGGVSLAWNYVWRQKPKAGAR